MTSARNSLAAHQFKDTGKPSTTNPLFSGTELKQDPSIQYLHPSNVFKPFIINRTMESVQTYGRKVRDSCTLPHFFKHHFDIRNPIFRQRPIIATSYHTTCSNVVGRQVTLERCDLRKPNSQCFTLWNFHACVKNLTNTEFYLPFP